MKFGKKGPQVTSLAGSSVSLHLRYLRRCGFCRLAGAARVPSPLRSLHTSYCTFALTATSMYVLQQCVYAYQNMSDMNKLARVMFVLLCHITCVSKQIVFHLDAARIDELVSDLDAVEYNEYGSWGAATHAARGRLLRATAARTSRLLRAYAGCGVATCVLWTALSVISRLRGQLVELPFWVFVDYTHPLVFVVVVTYSFYVTNLVAVGNMTIDALIATVLYQCKTQLTILRLNIESLPEVVRHITMANANEKYEKNLYRLFVECFMHYRKIAETMKLLQDIFGLVILIQFTVGGWILCMAAYQIVDLDFLSFEFASTTLFIICILAELFLYCYFGNEVTVESDRMVESMYATQWLGTPVRFQRSLLIMMERAKRPLRPVAGRIVPLSLDTYVTIIKSSYTFYAVLRQTK
ncbi:odorant receptor Or1-like [Aphomia sociella]